MKPIRIAGIAVMMATVLGATAFAADIFSVKTALNTGAAQKSCGISVRAGEELEFSADDLEMRLGLEPGSLRGVTFVSLPKSGQGRLVLDGARVDAYEFVDRGSLDRLRFVPEARAVAASVTLIPRAEEAVTTELLINVTDNWKAPPELRDFSLETIRNVAVSGYIGDFGPDGDGMSIRVVKPPNKGRVRFDGLRYVYTPYPDASGRDKFTIRAADSMNNFSNEARVSVRIEKPGDSFYYADMANDPSAYAAMKLREKGVMSGWRAGSQTFFYPGKAATRGEFIVTLMVASGLEASMKPTVNTGLPNDMEIPLYLKPYVKKAVDEGIWPPDQPFAPGEVPTRAEAAVLTARAAGITGLPDRALWIPDAAEIPDWAWPSYKSLAAHGMLVLHDNAARPLGELTNAYSADLMWQLWKHRHP